MELEKLTDLWGLSNLEKLVSTHSSDIYKVSKNNYSFILKRLNDKGLISEKDGAFALRTFQGKGAAKVVDELENFVLLEFIDGDKLSSLVKRGGDKKASEIISNLLLKLHQAKVPIQSRLPNLEKRFASLSSRGRKEAKKSVLYNALKVAEELIETEKSTVLLHGDIHHDNIINSSSRGWLSIDPQPLIGENLYDFANSFFNPDDCPSIVEEIERIKYLANTFSKATESDPTRLLKFAFAHGGLSISWQLDDGGQPARRLRISKMLESLLRL